MLLNSLFIDYNVQCFIIYISFPKYAYVHTYVPVIPELFVPINSSTMCLALHNYMTGPIKS